MYKCFWTVLIHWIVPWQEAQNLAPSSTPRLDFSPKTRIMFSSKSKFLCQQRIPSIPYNSHIDTHQLIIFIRSKILKNDSYHYHVSQSSIFLRWPMTHNVPYLYINQHRCKLRYVIFKLYLHSDMLNPYWFERQSIYRCQMPFVV